MKELLISNKHRNNRHFITQFIKDNAFIIYEEYTKNNISAIESHLKFMLPRRLYKTRKIPPMYNFTCNGLQKYKIEFIWKERIHEIKSMKARWGVSLEDIKIIPFEITRIF